MSRKMYDIAGYVVFFFVCMYTLYSKGDWRHAGWFALKFSLSVGGLFVFNLLFKIGMNMVPWILSVLVLSVAAFKSVKLLVVFRAPRALFESKRDALELQGFDAYSDLTCQFEHAALVYLVQVALMMWYCKSLLESGEKYGADKFTKASMFQSLDAHLDTVFVQLFILRTSTTKFCSSFWIRVQGIDQVFVPSSQGDQGITLRKGEVVVRMMFSLTANISTTVVGLTFPCILLDSATSIDFVKDAFAAVFITSLATDFASPKVFKLSLSSVSHEDSHKTSHRDTE